LAVGLGRYRPGSRVICEDKKSGRMQAEIIIKRALFMAFFYLAIINPDFREFVIFFN